MHAPRPPYHGWHAIAYRRRSGARTRINPLLLSKMHKFWAYIFLGKHLLTLQRE